MEEAALEALFTEITGKPFPKDLPANDPFPAVCADPSHALGCGSAPEDFFDLSDLAEPAADLVDAPLDAAHDLLHGFLNEHPMRRMIRICEVYDVEPLQPRINRDNTISMFDKNGQKKPYPVKIGSSGAVRATERFPGLPNVVVATNILPRGRELFKRDYLNVKRMLSQARVGGVFNVRQMRFESAVLNDKSPREVLNIIRRQQTAATVGGIYYSLPEDVLVVDALWGWMNDRGTYQHTMCHEFGHRFHRGCHDRRGQGREHPDHAFDRHVKAMWMEARSNSDLAVSPYSLTTYFEFWAEVFGLYVQGRLSRRPALNRWVKAVLDTFRSRNIFC